MKNKLQLAGQKFNLLTGVRYLYTRKRDGKALWLFNCECGNNTKLVGSLAKSGKVKSCGCLHRSVSFVPKKEIENQIINFIRRKKRTPSIVEMNNKKKFSLEYRQATKRLGSLKKIISKYNLKANKIGRKYTFNYKYFDKINTDAKAYFLGLIATDGSIRPSPHNQCIIRLNKKDKFILQKLKMEIKSNAPLVFYDGKKAIIKRDDQYGLTLGDKYFTDNLKKYGFYGNKTFNLKFPKPNLLPNKLISSFIRGVFDGDGTVHKKNCEVSFVSGSKFFISSLKKNLEKNSFSNLRIAKRKSYNFYELTIRMSAYKTGMGWESLNKKLKGKMIRKSNSLKFYRFIYKNMKNDICLKRKKKIFEKLLIKENRKYLNLSNIKTIPLKQFGL